MAEEAALELEDSVKPKSKKKLIIFGVGGVVLLIVIAITAWMLLGSDEAAESTSAVEGAATEQAARTGEAYYAAMPRPFLFNLSDNGRTRLVEIKVQLMVRGNDDDTLIRKHIPLIEDALLTTFSGADIQKLSSPAGKDELRQLALRNVQNTLQPVTGRTVVEKVLFTGFVMQ
ncbi:flagellar basal body-associated protein FliL [Shewanella schlegeliana]|uniref:Flagellar protein FliL n=1 Tax=Shewanella schlegeliana TaxID=190308 RepID=A0ABS1ST43_9GAMM|nr:flagellar basal body-associated protein FliL [Shewanella schlegeliana]MBL4911589.1 flagellar basal body-associated protein FliL [Shewanella schlegeliana]MCL1111727.1 flagellar basal body-associated protein FliL [Shewanella schlegeliana]GIU36160.1 flagellar basal body-associated protein FliL [Shewanella schlegeliana]